MIGEITEKHAEHFVIRCDASAGPVILHTRDIAPSTMANNLHVGSTVEFSHLEMIGGHFVARHPVVSIAGQ